MAQRSYKMRLIHRDRAEPALLQMAGCLHVGVDLAGVVSVDIAKGAPQPVSVRGHCHVVHVIRHQAVGSDLHSGALRPIGQQIKIERIVPILKEHPLTPFAALGDVVQNARED